LISPKEQTLACLQLHLHLFFVYFTTFVKHPIPQTVIIASALNKMVKQKTHILVYIRELYDYYVYDSLSDVGEIRVYQRADFQSGSRVLKKVF